MTGIGPFPPLSPEARHESLKCAVADAPQDIWIFAYGSLMWDSGFAVAERRTARLHDFQRSFCIWSVLARGTPENPGLGLGLLEAPGAYCDGIALRLEAATRDTSLEQIWEREMWTGIYDPRWVDLQTSDGRETALTFVVNRVHPQFAGGLSTQEMAERVLSGTGKFGACRDYLYQTVDTLRTHGLSYAEFADLLVETDAQSRQQDRPEN